MSISKTVFTGDCISHFLTYVAGALFESVDKPTLHSILKRIDQTRRGIQAPLSAADSECIDKLIDTLSDVLDELSS